MALVSEYATVHTELRLGISTEAECDCGEPVRIRALAYVDLCLGYAGVGPCAAAPARVATAQAGDPSGDWLLAFVPHRPRGC